MSSDWHDPAVPGFFLCVDKMQTTFDADGARDYPAPAWQGLKIFWALYTAQETQFTNRLAFFVFVVCVRERKRARNEQRQDKSDNSFFKTQYMGYKITVYIHMLIQDSIDKFHFAFHLLRASI